MVAGSGADEARSHQGIMASSTPTSYPDVNEILNILFTPVKEVLQDQLIGMYLFGSLANGDFDQASDIDILFVTEHTISEEVFKALFETHERIARIDSPWAVQLEVSYIPRDALRLFDPFKNKHPHIDRGPGEKLHIMEHHADWIVQRYILRERGITITGPDPKTLIDSVSPEDLRRAALLILQSWIRHFLDDPGQLKPRGYQSYTVLTLCRILYTYEHGDVVSKPAAAAWAKQSLGEEWVGLIERAWTGRQTPNLKARPEDINGTLEFIHYALKTCNLDESRINEIPGADRSTK
jgi:predicted nucleotidyltransferase